MFNEEKSQKEIKKIRNYFYILENRDVYLNVNTGVTIINRKQYRVIDIWKLQFTFLSHTNSLWNLDIYKTPLLKKTHLKVNKK